MSDALHPTRLEWDGTKGIARHQGVTVQLTKPPSTQWAEVHYAPGCQAEIRDRPGDALREMQGDEIRAVPAWLRHMASQARSAAQQD